LLEERHNVSSPQPFPNYDSLVVNSMDLVLAAVKTRV